MITVCPSCSGLDVEKLEEKYGKGNVISTCLGECGGREGLIIGYVNDDFIEVKTEEEFIKAAENN